MLYLDLTCSPLPQGRAHPRYHCQQARYVRFGDKSGTRPDFRGCHDFAPLAPTTGACFSLRVDFESKFRCPSRGLIERLASTGELVSRTCCYSCRPLFQFPYVGELTLPLFRHRRAYISVLVGLPVDFQNIFSSNTKEPRTITPRRTGPSASRSSPLPSYESASSPEPMNPGHRTVLWAPRTRLSSPSRGYSEKWKQQQSSVRSFRAWIYGTGVPTSPGAQSAAGDSRRRRSASGLLEDEMPGCDLAASKEHRLLRRKMRSKWEQCHHPTRYPGGSAICGTSDTATSVLGTTGTSSSLHSSPFAQDPSDCLSRMSCETCFSAMAARGRKGTVMFHPPTHGPHAHLPGL